MTTTTVVANDNGLLFFSDREEVVGYLFSHRGDDSPTRPGTYTLGHNLVGAYAPSGYVGELTPEVVKAHNEALTTLEANAILEQLPERIAAYWVSGGYFHNSRCGCPSPHTPNVRGGPVLPEPVTLWNGRFIGHVLYLGKKTTTLGGASRAWLRVAIGAAVYGGYATSTRDLVYLKRLKGVV